MKTSVIAGRIAVYMPKHPKANNRGYILRYRHVMEKKLGRRLRSKEEVHHKNGNKRDDRVSNLKLMSKADHCRHHKLWEKGGKARMTIDRRMVRQLMKDGLGCRYIAWICDCNVSSAKRIMRTLRA